MERDGAVAGNSSVIMTQYLQYCGKKLSVKSAEISCNENNERGENLS